MSAKMLEVSLLRVETVLRLERDAWPMVKRLRQATNEYAPPPAHKERWLVWGGKIYTQIELEESKNNAQLGVSTPGFAFAYLMSTTVGASCGLKPKHQAL